MIRVPQVRVVDEDGSQLGVMPTLEALRLAQERGFDLVEVAPLAAPPVTRLLDFGQYKYELSKREKEAKRKQRSVEFKEIRLYPKMAMGDFDTRVRRAIEFLEDGDRVKVAVQFRGRELTHPQIGRDLLTKFSEAIKDHGVVERAAILEGKMMHITIASVHKPKPRAIMPATEPSRNRQRAQASVTTTSPGDETEVGAPDGREASVVPEGQAEGAAERTEVDAAIAAHPAADGQEAGERASA